ncbi:MAG: OPT/YSL family transporter [Myxococcota bacterium]
MAEPTHASEQRFKWLPAMGTWKFHFLLGAVAILVLGPLGGVTATFMNFKIGFFVGGQVLAGILGSAVTFGYGAEGKHGANYMQTLAASVASMAAMAVLIQAMYWLGFPVPDAWQLILYYLCIGMFGVGVGMLYTPLLVDKMHLTYPSGLAVANILRALTDKALLKASILKLSLGTGIGIIGGALAKWVPFVEASNFSGATFGAGMIVGARIGIPAIFVGLIGTYLVPTLVQSGWLNEGEPFRKIFFIIALGAILGAAIVDITLVLRDFARQLKARKSGGAEVVEVEAFKKVNSRRLIAWVAFWAAATFLVATQLFDQNPLYVIIAIALVFVFMIVNGISQGISDSNPISSAFVLTVLLLSVFGLGLATGGLVCASILLISVSIGGDMQQDRSTGWRLGTSRVNQFRYQVVGVTMGAALAVAFAALFMKTNPELLLDQTEPKVIELIAKERAAVTVAETRLADAAKVKLPDFMAKLQSMPEAEKKAVDAQIAAEAATVKKAIQDNTLAKGEKDTYDAAKAAFIEMVGSWQSAMTYKFVGALTVFMDRPPAVGIGNDLSTAESGLVRRAFTRLVDPTARATFAAGAAIAEQRVAAAAGLDLEAWKKAQEKMNDEQAAAVKAAVAAAKDKAMADIKAGALSPGEKATFEEAKADATLRAQRGAWFPSASPAIMGSNGARTYLAALTEDPDGAELPADLGTPEELKAYATTLAGAERSHKKGVQVEALLIGISIGLITEILRKTLKKSKGYQKWKKSGPVAASAEFVLDTTVLSSPYASSFGGFVDLWTSIWFGLGGSYTSVSDWVTKRYGKKDPAQADLPEDMSTNSLVGGGLIAGESLFYLAVGISTLVGG